MKSLQEEVKELRRVIMTIGNYINLDPDAAERVVRDAIRSFKDEWQVVIEWNDNHPEHCIGIVFSDEEEAQKYAKKMSEGASPRRVKRFRVERRPLGSNPPPLRKRPPPDAPHTPGGVCAR